jgi:hypothetical protein
VDHADPQLGRGAQPICHRIRGSGTATDLSPHEARKSKTI